MIWFRGVTNPPHQLDFKTLSSVETFFNIVNTFLIIEKGEGTPNFRLSIKIQGTPNFQLSIKIQGTLGL